MLLRASVNSFGYGGTNAHLIVEAVDKSSNHDSKGRNKAIPGPATKTGTPRLFVLSHDHEGEIGKLAANLKQFVSDNDSTDQFLDGLAYTLSERRSFLDYRSFIYSSTGEELIDGLEDLANGSTREQRSSEAPALCLAFTGKDSNLEHEYD
jgi:acyl transferase domain-containing protein